VIKQFVCYVFFYNTLLNFIKSLYYISFLKGIHITVYIVKSSVFVLQVWTPAVDIINSLMK